MDESVGGPTDMDTNSIPYSDLTALVALAQAKSPEMVTVDEYKGWLVSSRARDLVEFVHRREDPSKVPDQLSSDYRAIFDLSGAPWSKPPAAQAGL